MSLYCFDVDGTLIESYFRKGVKKTVENYGLVTLLPGRAEYIRELAHRGHEFALVTNQAGVALGYQSAADVYAKMARVVAELHFFHARPLSLQVCMHHPEARLDEWREKPCWRRKPEPGMLIEACEAHGTAPVHAFFVGDMETDAEAARRAGMAYLDAATLFA